MSYASIIATAARLIAAKGQVVEWRSNSNVIGNVSLPWKPTGTNATVHSPSIVFLPEGRIGYEFLAALAGTEVPQGCIEGFMAGNVGFVPTLKDTVIRNNVMIAIETIDVIAPDGTPILYIIRFKK